MQSSEPENALVITDAFSKYIIIIPTGVQTTYISLTAYTIIKDVLLKIKPLSCVQHVLHTQFQNNSILIKAKVSRNIRQNTKIFGRKVHGVNREELGL